MSDLRVSWCDSETGKWFLLDLADLNIKTVSSVCHLLGRKRIEVVAMDGDDYIVNSARLRAVYQGKKKKVRTFAGILASGSDNLQQSFRRVGFGAAVL